MKRYTLKLAIAFVFIYVLLMVVVVFAYTIISQNFLIDQAESNLMSSGKSIASIIDTQLEFDYQRLSTLIDYYESNSLDPITSLEQIQSTLYVQDNNYLGFGVLNGNVLSYNGETYTYIQDYSESDIRQKVSFYSFNKAFGTGEETVCIFFSVGDYLAFFDAESYLDPILEHSAVASEYAIMSSNNTLFYQSYENATLSYFYDYLRPSYPEEQINGIKDVIMNDGSLVIQAPFHDISSYIGFYPLSQSLSDEYFYLVEIYDQVNVLNSISYLSNILWALFLVIFIIFAIALLILYKILEQKQSDIENARLTHYYAKPYIIKIKYNGKIKSYNRSFKRLLGEYDVYSEVSDFKIKEEDDKESLMNIIHQQKSFTVLFQIGIDKIAYIRLIPIKVTGGFLLIGNDVTHIEGKFDTYRNMALYDPITNLPNLNSLQQDLQSLFDDKDLLSRKNSLIAFDVVAYSKINLLLGEKSGERFLVILSELVKQSLEGYPATIYNFDSDVFVILLKDIENYNWVQRWISKILTQFEQPITLDKNFIEVKVKIGVFNIESDRYEILNPETAYDNVMLALNHAKESAQHQSFVYDVSLTMVASREQRMEIDLANGIKNHEFVMALQPQYNNQTEKIIGFEALIRWKNPKYGNESPLKFIEMAEKNNMIIDIGRIALHETFMIAKEMEEYDIHISINISPVQILQAGFVNDVISIFEQYELKKHSICLEITETFLIGSFELVINKLKLLQKYGFDIHLDDFGTGYSSLQYLRDLPINTIKIDRAFIINLETDTHSRAIVSMISNLAKNIGLQVISEGIENDKQNQIVYKAGCDIIQGYLIGPAVDKQSAIQLIKAYNIDKSIHVNLQKNVKTR